MVPTKHTLVALVEDKPGVLNRMVSLFRRRGFNIASIAVGSSELSGFSRVTFVVDGPLAMVEQVRKQLGKVVDVVKVSDITEENIVIRELALVKVKATSATRSEIIQIVDVFRSDIVDVAQDSLTIEVTGAEQKIESLLDLLRTFGIKEIVRTGCIAMTRGGAGTANGSTKGRDNEQTP
ncbi:MAG: acetolactate synthase small subunit [Dehalococcoidia bacterium]|nr:acetolactate synthase small subunit [Dehalococcoidia bacterium]